MLQLTRAHISYAKRVPGPVNVTIKSSVGLARMFTPTWDMVMEHKRGRLTNTDYTAQYHSILNKLTKEQVLAFYDQQREAGPTCTFLCFCQDGRFCHTHLLIDWLVDQHPFLFADVRAPQLNPQLI